MVMTPRGFAVAVAISRTVLVTLSSAAFACALRAPDVNFTAFIFLKVALVLDLFWNIPRLLYDWAQVFLNAPLPPQLMLFSALVVAEWGMMLLLLASGWSTMAVVVFFQIDTSACHWAHPKPCSHWHTASTMLTLWAWLVSGVIALLMFSLRASSAILQEY